MKRSAFIFVLLAVAFSCQQKSFDSKEAMLTYLHDTDNEYAQTKLVNGIEISLSYKPTDLLVLQELNDGKDRHIVDSLRKKYEQYLYFNLSFSKEGKELLSTVPGNRNEFGAMVNQLAFGMTDKVHLYTSKKDTIHMLDYVYPRMYGMSKSTSMLLVYPKKELSSNDVLNLSIEDMGMQTGEVKFKIPNKIIMHQPTLSF